jgi:hypothetical protein
MAGGMDDLKFLSIEDIHQAIKGFARAPDANKRFALTALMI